MDTVPINREQLLDDLHTLNIYRVLGSFGIPKDMYVQDCLDGMIKDYTQDLHDHARAELAITLESSTELRELLESIIILTDRVLETIAAQGIP